MIYSLVKFYIKKALHLFYYKIDVTYQSAIPNDKAVLFVANHQNAMIDPLVIGITLQKPVYFLARAAAFKKKIAAYLLTKINAIAIYRVRDGVDSKTLNKAVFKHCLDLLNNKEHILIFPEGSHNIKRQVRDLRLGFTRITFDFIKANPNKKFIIIPVGLNYTNTVSFGASLHIIYGKPITANDFVDLKNIKESQKKLIEVVSAQLKQLTVHIPNKNYDLIHDKIPQEAYLYPEKTNLKIKNNKLKNPLKNKQKKKTVFYRFMQINSIFPFLIWNWLKPKVKNIEFLSTFKFTLGITVFPLFYLIQAAFIKHFFGVYYALLYLVISVLLVYLSRNKT
jgi:1-acyl-sn-glycerol-3-phosphate acyltransferase